MELVQLGLLMNGPVLGGLRPNISFRSRGTNTQVASGGITLGGPTGAAQGDLIVACISYRGTAPFTVPAGWTLVQQVSNGNTSTDPATAIASGLMAYIVRGSSDPSFTFTRTGGDVAQGRAFAYKGEFDSLVLEDSVATTAAVASADISSSRGIITTAPGSLVLIQSCGATNIGSSSAYTSATSPTDGWTEQTDDESVLGSTTSIAVGDNLKPEAGDTGALSFHASVTARHVIIGAAFKQTNPNATNSFLLEDGSHLLLEDSTYLLVE